MLVDVDDDYEHDYIHAPKKSSKVHASPDETCAHALRLYKVVAS